MAAKRDHGAETAAFVAVVRAVVDELTTRHAKELPRAVLEGLATLEHFAAGNSLSFETLDSVRQLYDLKQPDRALHWAQSAIGNLGFFASKARGWKDADASIMDAASYALSSARNDNSAPWEELAQLRADVLASQQARSGPVAKVKGRAKPKRVKDELVVHLGVEANKQLVKRRGVFDAKARGDEATLRALLEEHGLPLSTAVVEFDARYGGLIFADVGATDGEDWLVGAHACLASKAHSVEKGEWVPIAYSPNDVIFTLDPQGVVYVYDSIEGGAHERYAANADQMLIQILLSTD